MVEADKLLDDEAHRPGLRRAGRASRTQHHARPQTLAEMALRLLLLKHVRNWSFDTLEREVKMSLAYRDFTRIRLGKVPDAKTLARIAQSLGGGVIAKLHERATGGDGAREGRLRVEIDSAVLYLTTPESAFVLGAEFIIDGGMATL